MKNIKLEFNKFLEDATTTVDIATFSRPLMAPIKRDCCNGVLINEKKKKKMKKKN